MKRSVFSLLAALALFVVLAVPAAAHTQTVTPPGRGETIISRVLARPWIQAHCQSAAPAVTGGASGGVVVFAPPEALCMGVLNPGGQTTGP
jgi:hypothetical protein